jgi:hypothetical protein
MQNNDQEAHAMFIEIDGKFINPNAIAYIENGKARGREGAYIRFFADINHENKDGCIFIEGKTAKDIASQINVQHKTLP